MPPGAAPQTKVPQAQVNYRPASDGKACGGCSHFIEPNACQLVDGKILPEMTCDLFEPMSGAQVLGATNSMSDYGD